MYIILVLLQFNNALWNGPIWKPVITTSCFLCHHYDTCYLLIWIEFRHLNVSDLIYQKNFFSKFIFISHNTPWDMEQRKSFSGIYLVSINNDVVVCNVICNASNEMLLFKQSFILSRLPSIRTEFWFFLFCFVYLNHMAIMAFDMNVHVCACMCVCVNLWMA